MAQSPKKRARRGVQESTFAPTLASACHAAQAWGIVSNVPAVNALREEAVKLMARLVERVELLEAMAAKTPGAVFNTDADCLGHLDAVAAFGRISPGGCAQYAPEFIDGDGNSPWRENRVNRCTATGAFSIFSDANWISDNLPRRWDFEYMGRPSFTVDTPGGVSDQLDLDDPTVTYDFPFAAMETRGFMEIYPMTGEVVCGSPNVVCVCSVPQQKPLRITMRLPLTNLGSFGGEFPAGVVWTDPPVLTNTS